MDFSFRLLLSALWSCLVRDWFRLTFRPRHARAEAVRWRLRNVRLAIHRRVCGRCERPMRAGNPRLPVSHGLCRPCSSALHADITARAAGRSGGRLSVSALNAATVRVQPRHTLTIVACR